MRLGGLGGWEWIIILVLCCGGPGILATLAIGFALFRRSNSKQTKE